jgi:hypothetical protein
VSDVHEFGFAELRQLRAAPTTAAGSEGIAQLRSTCPNVETASGAETAQLHWPGWLYGVSGSRGSGVSVAGRRHEDKEGSDPEALPP